MVRVKVVREEAERALTESRGFTNSSIHVKGLVNGRGLVNGNGLVNRRGLTNGEGLINGNGLVNGQKWINGRAFSGNNGLTNGNGITNGLNLKSNKFGIVAQKDIRSFIAGLVAVILIAPLVLFFFGYYNPPPPVLKVITIDGDFTDWTSIPKYSEALAAPPDNINLREYSVDYTAEMLSFYIKVNDNFFSQEDPDIFEIFIDADGDKSTGYEISEDFGSDYRIELYGWNASIHGSPKLTEFSGSDRLNFSAWSSIGNAKAAAHLNELEAQIDTEMLDNFRDDDFKVLIYGKDFEGREVYSSVTPSKTFGALLVEQRPLKNVTTGSGDVAELSFHAKGSDVNVNGLTLTTTGGSVGSIDSFTVLADTTVRKNINLDVSDLSDGVLAIVNLDAVDANRPVKIIGRETRVYKGSYPSDIVVIDGLFEEWKSPINISADAMADVNNIDIDMAEYSTYKNITDAYFYLKVSGEMFAGTSIPKRIRRLPPTVPGPPGPPAPPPVVVQAPRKSGEDVTRIYIDSDGNESTGYLLSEDFGSDYMLEIKGIHGKITNKALHNWTGNGWDPMSSPVEAEVDYTRLESSIPLSNFGELNNTKVVFKTTDWSMQKDITEEHEGLKGEGTKSIVTIENSGMLTTSTAYSSQRKLFYTGSYYFSFYYNGTLGNTTYEYSTDGSSWSDTPEYIFSFSDVNNVSVWYSDPYVFVVGDTSDNDLNVTVIRGTISGSTITWDQETNVTVSSQSLDSKVAFISRNSTGYLWVVSRVHLTVFPDTYGIVANRSTDPDEVDSWDPGSTLRTLITTSDIFPIIVPLSGGDMYAIWYQNSAPQATIEGIGYSAVSGWDVLYTTIDYSAVGVSEGRGPSAVVDTSYDIHLLYSNRSSYLNYTQYSGGGWGSPQSLDGGVGLIKLYPTISSVNTTSPNYLYAFWLNSTTAQISGKYSTDGGSSWNWATYITANLDAKGHITSVYNVSNEGYVGWQWVNATTNYDVLFESIPEFQEILIPISMLIAVPLILLRRKNRK